MQQEKPFVSPYDVRLIFTAMEQAVKTKGGWAAIREWLALEQNPAMKEEMAREIAELAKLEKKARNRV